jgi:hypothetical protein
MSTDTSIRVQGFFANLSPDAFRLWARHYLQCRDDFRAPEGYSPVPYFLLCRAIELELKARHLEDLRQHQVKKQFGHDLVKAYNALPEEHRVLSEPEMQVLLAANAVYMDKGFEYMSMQDALTAFKRSPDLAKLDQIARKFIPHDG